MAGTLQEIAKLLSSAARHHVVQRTAHDRISPSNQCRLERRTGSQHVLKCGESFRSLLACLVTREAAAHQAFHSASCVDPYPPNVGSIGEAASWFPWRQHRVADTALKVVECSTQAIKLVCNTFVGASLSEEFAYDG